MNIMPVEQDSAASPLQFAGFNLLHCSICSMNSYTGKHHCVCTTIYNGPQNLGLQAPSCDCGYCPSRSSLHPSGGYLDGGFQKQAFSPYVTPVYGYGYGYGYDGLAGLTGFNTGMIAIVPRIAVKSGCRLSLTVEGCRNERGHGRMKLYRKIRSQRSCLAILALTLT